MARAVEAHQEAEARCRGFLEDVWARGEPDAVARYLATDARVHRFGMPDGAPVAAYAAFVAAMHQAFPDLVVEVMEVIAGPDRAACRYHVRGTHEGEFIGIPPTGRAIAFTGLCMMHFRGGMIVEEWSDDDVLAVFNQLGVLGVEAGW